MGNMELTETQINIIGDVAAYIGASLVFISYIIQIVKMVKLKSFRELSYGFVFLQLSVCVLYLIYGSLVGLMPIYISNAVIFFAILSSIILKAVYDKKYPIKIIETGHDAKHINNVV